MPSSSTNTYSNLPGKFDGRVGDIRAISYEQKNYIAIKFPDGWHFAEAKRIEDVNPRDPIRYSLLNG